MFPTEYVCLYVNSDVFKSIPVSKLVFAFPSYRYFLVVYVPKLCFQVIYHPFLCLSEADLVIWVQNGTYNVLHPSWNTFPSPFSAITWLLNGIICVLINSISWKFQYFSFKSYLKYFKVIFSILTSNLKNPVSRNAT